MLAYGSPVSSFTGNASSSERSNTDPPVAIAQYAHDPGSADLFGHREAGISQMLRNGLGRLDLLVRQLGVLVDVLVERLLPRPYSRQPAQDRRRRGRRLCSHSVPLWLEGD